MGEETFNDVVMPVVMLVFSILAASGMIWERSRHRFNSMDTAVNNLKKELHTAYKDRDGNILVRWRKLFPMSKEMASEYAQTLGYEYTGWTLPGGSPAQQLKFRFVESESTDKEKP